jgi:hypothetical protein
MSELERATTDLRKRKKTLSIINASTKERITYIKAITV